MFDTKLAPKLYVPVFGSPLLARSIPSPVAIINIIINCGACILFYLKT